MTQIRGSQQHALQCRAVLIDLDGTLVESRDAVMRGWLAWAKRYGVPTHAIPDVIHGRGAAEAINLLQPGLSPEELLDHVRAVLGYQETDPEPAHAVPGASELVRGVGGRPWAIVTACSAALARARLAAATLPVPPVLVCDEDVTAGKPDPQGYQLALRRLGIEPREAVAIEDTPPGVAAARAAGVRVVAVTATHHEDSLAEADLVVSALTRLTLVPTRLGLLLSVVGG